MKSFIYCQYSLNYWSRRKFLCIFKSTALIIRSIDQHYNQTPCGIRVSFNHWSFLSLSLSLCSSKGCRKCWIKCSSRCTRRTSEVSRSRAELQRPLLFFPLNHSEISRCWTWMSCYDSGCTFTLCLVLWMVPLPRGMTFRGTFVFSETIDLPNLIPLL